LTVEDLGRRPLLLIGVSSIVVSLLALGGSQLVLTGQAETWTSVIALLLYVGAYQVTPCLSDALSDMQAHVMAGDMATACMWAFAGLLLMS
jgi:hypothetical protein